MTVPHLSFEPSRTYAQALERAAALWGIEAEYWDIWGTRHETSAEARRSILEALGVPCNTLEAVDQAVEQRLWEEWSRPLPVTLVVSESEPRATFPLSVPAGLENCAVRVEVHWEDGSSQDYELGLGELPASATATLRGRCFVRKPAPLPRQLRLGYHALRVVVVGLDGGALGGDGNLIVGPDRAWLPPELERGGKAAGVAVSLFGLRSERNWGCGDFTDLERIIDWAAEDFGAGFVALNPLHAIANRQPFNTSPYLPNCIFHRNPIYLDVERVEEIAESARARALLESPEVRAEIDALRESEFVEYERVYALKMRLLRLAFETFLERGREGAARAAAFEQYCRQEGELLELYAIHCALDEWLHARNPGVWIWPDWPEEYRDPHSPETRAFASEHHQSVLFHKYVQWLTESQLAETQTYARRKGLSIGLYHDLALATDRCGSDVWAHRPYFATRCRVGAPPDDFAPRGQDWGFPPPNAQRHREDGYRLFAESIRQNCRYGGALRIDHVMRFFRLFWIPDGMEPAEGTYVREPHEDLLRIIALESVRQRVLIVGEDLGTVEPSFREELARFGILSYRLLYFEKNERREFRAPEEYPRRAIVAATTHDLPTLAGFWLGRDIEGRREAGLLGDDAAYRAQHASRAEEKQRMLDALWRLGLLPDGFPRDAASVPVLSGELHSAIIGFLAMTPSMLMVLSQEDLVKETEQQNLPGSTWQYPNWRRKTRFTTGQLKSLPEARAFTAMVRDWLARTGR